MAKNSEIRKVNVPPTRVFGAMLRRYWVLALIALVFATASADASENWLDFLAGVSASLAFLLYVVGHYSRVRKSLAASDAECLADDRHAQLQSRLHSIEGKVSRGEDLLRKAVAARRAPGALVLVALLVDMVTLAIKLPDTADDIDAISLWWLDSDRDHWEILACEGVSALTQTNFRQRRLESPETGAGIVANLAASSSEESPVDGVFISTDARAHPWFAVDPDKQRDSIGLAAVLIRDRNLEAIGAVCITSARAGAIPLADDLEARERLSETLLVWQIAFTLPLERLMELRHGS